MNNLRLFPALLAISSIAAFAQQSPPSPGPRKPAALEGNFPIPIHYRYANAINVKRGVEEAYVNWWANYGGAMGVELDRRVTHAGDEISSVIKRVVAGHPEYFLMFYCTGHVKVPDMNSAHHTPITGDITDFHPGHWCYLPRLKVLQGLIPKQDGETTIKIDMTPTKLGPREGMDDEDVAGSVGGEAFSFYTSPFTKTKRGEDVCLYTLKADGTPDWDNSEQVQVTAVDEKAGTITIRRGLFGSEPREFRGEIYAAIHDQVARFQGWLYNFSTFCPKDAQGRTAGDVWAKKYVGILSPGGVAYDHGFRAIQHDTLMENLWGKRGIDLNNNGVDDPLEDTSGVNWFAVGMSQALEKLRAGLPDDVLIMPDAGNRGYYHVNGWEVEGFPGRQDPDWRDYASVCNRLELSRKICAEPRLTTVQHKIFNFTLGSDEPGVILQGTELPFSLSRVVMALSTVYGAAVTWYSLPPKDPDGTSGVYDEMRMGEARRPGWLGKPIGEPVYPGTETPDLFAGILAKPNSIEGLDGTVVRSDGGRLILSNPDKSKKTRIRIPVTTGAPDLLVFARWSGKPREGVAVKMPREAHAFLSGGEAFDGYLVPSNPGGLERGMILKDGSVKMIEGAAASAKAEFSLNIHNLRAWHRDPKMEKFFWQVRRKTPVNARLHFWAFNAPLSVEAAEVGADGKPGEFREIASVKRTQGPAPILRNVDLAAIGLAGKDVVFRFLATARNGSAGGQWGEVTIAAGDSGGNVPAGPIRARIEGALPPEPQRQIFHFPRVPTGTPLTFELAFEGGEEVAIESLTAHAAPRAVAREFENGIVLANPSMRPFAFDLAKMFPGKSFQRFQAVPTQDTATNNGQPVGPSVTIDRRDGLFLVRKD